MAGRGSVTDGRARLGPKARAKWGGAGRGLLDTGVSQAPAPVHPVLGHASAARRVVIMLRPGGAGRGRWGGACSTEIRAQVRGEFSKPIRRGRRHAAAPPARHCSPPGAVTLCPLIAAIAAIPSESQSRSRSGAAQPDAEPAGPSLAIRVEFSELARYHDRAGSSDRVSAWPALRGLARPTRSARSAPPRPVRPMEPAHLRRCALRPPPTPPRC